MKNVPWAVANNHYVDRKKKIKNLLGDILGGHLMQQLYTEKRSRKA